MVSGDAGKMLEVVHNTGAIQASISLFAAHGSGNPGELSRVSDGPAGGRGRADGRR